MTSRPLPDESRARVEDWKARTDPLVIVAMRKLFGVKSGRGYANRTLKALTPEEREALDAWLAPRLDALVDVLMEEFRR